MAVALAQLARCVLYYKTISARETLALSRCIPLAGGAARHRTVSPVHHSQEEPSSSSCTSMTGETPALPWTPSGRVETALSPAPPSPSLRQGFGPAGQPCAEWMRANLVAVGSRPGRCQLSPDPIEYPATPVCHVCGKLALLWTAAHTRKRIIRGYTLIRIKYRRCTRACAA